MKWKSGKKAKGESEGDAQEVTSQIEAPMSGANDRDSVGDAEGVASIETGSGERDLPPEGDATNNLRLDRVFTRRGREVRPPKRLDL